MTKLLKCSSDTDYIAVSEGTITVNTLEEAEDTLKKITIKYDKGRLLGREIGFGEVNINFGFPNKPNITCNINYLPKFNKKIINTPFFSFEGDIAYLDIPDYVNRLDIENIIKVPKVIRTLVIKGGKNCNCISNLSKCIKTVEFVDMRLFKSSICDLISVFKDLAILKEVLFNDNLCIGGAYLFKNCNSLKSVDLSNIHTKSTNAEGMFENCINLEYVNFGSNFFFNLCNKELPLYDMFSGCDSLRVVKGLKMPEAGNLDNRSKGLLNNKGNNFNYCKLIEYVETNQYYVRNMLTKFGLAPILNVVELWYDDCQVATRIYVGETAYDCCICVKGGSKEFLENINGNLISIGEYQFSRLYQEVDEEFFLSYYNRVKDYLD